MDKVTFPLGCITVVTGVSGSGKSTLVHDILYKGLKKMLGGGKEEVGSFEKMTGMMWIDNIEIVDPGFDWTLLDVEADSMTMKMEKVIASGDEPVKLVVIPECDKTGYSLILADELDVSLLQLLAKPFSVAAILVEIAKEFDEEELKNAYADFEHLIFGRIKLALLNRLVKLI